MMIVVDSMHIAYLYSALKSLKTYHFTSKHSKRKFRANLLHLPSNENNLQNNFYFSFVLDEARFHLLHGLSLPFNGLVSPCPPWNLHSACHQYSYSCWSYKCWRCCSLFGIDKIRPCYSFGIAGSRLIKKVRNYHSENSSNFTKCLF